MSGRRWPALFATATVVLVMCSLIACSSADHPAQPTNPDIASISIDSSTVIFERGGHDTLTATVRDRSGAKVNAPVVWQSSNEKVATFQYGGVLVALDTGITTVTASSLSVTSAPIGIRVVWLGPAKIVAAPWTPPSAVNPGATLRDSVRVTVTNLSGAPVPNAKVVFAAVTGNGTFSPATATTGPAGVAAAQWTVANTAGKNVATASVVFADGTPDSLVVNNNASFTVTSYPALIIQAGSGQTGQILAKLAVTPSVKLVDSTGAPRRGVPVQFTAFKNGQVAVPLVSTDVDGVASPGAWTLGDAPGDETLTATVEDATVTFHASATGSPIHYMPAQIDAGAYSTCSLANGGAVSCWGQSPQNGTGDTASTATPTAVKGALVAASLASGSTHYCALTQAGAAWCWGINALVDTTGKTATTATPTQLPSAIVWKQLSPGGGHNCGIDVTSIAYCWGLNSSGQLGTRDTTRHFTPTAVSGAFTFSQISSGTLHTCALTADGSAFCWGSNQNGQLGDGTTQSRTSPTAVNGGITFLSLGTADASTCGLSTTGRAYCWGGITVGNQTSPITYSDAPTFVSLSVGGAHACALTGDGTAYCWGNNSSGQLGDSTLTSRATPTAVAGGLHFSQISAGFVHTCGRTLDGSVACWGFNGSGELGDRTAGTRTVPHYIVLGVQP